ncbi:MAG TPA: hypothetical protein VF534_01425 [Paraburkholderia sp.]
MKFVAHQKEFMETAGQVIDRPNKEQTELYLREMLEAVGETMIAANPLRAADIRGHISKLSSMAVTSSRTDRVGLFANLIGVMMNATGVGVSAGLPLSAGWREVHRARMSTYDGSTTATLATLLDHAA